MEDELLDVVDEHDVVVGQELRNMLQKSGLPPKRGIRVVNLFVKNARGEILLPKRSANRRIYPNCYDFSCGEHVSAGEEYDDAARRGMKEELGVADAKVTLVAYLNPGDGVSSFMKVYLTEAEGPFAYDTNGIADLAWFTPEQIEALCRKNPLEFKGDFIPVFRRLRWNGIL